MEGCILDIAKIKFTWILKYFNKYKNWDGIYFIWTYVFFNMVRKVMEKVENLPIDV